MIQKLTEDNFTQLKEYLLKEAEPNLFFIANIENYGLEGNDVEAFVNISEVNDKQEWDFVLLRYFSITLIYSQNETYNIKEATNLIDTFEKVDTIGGKHSVVEKLKNYFPSFTFRPTTLLRCTKDSLIKQPSDASIDLEGNILPIEKGDDLVDFYFTIEEFEKNYKGQEERYRQRTKENLQKDSTAYVFCDNGKIVSSAMAGAQCSVGSMLLGVATNLAYRKKGLASILVVTACKNQFEQGKEFVALFSDNPEAASLYKKLGFEEVGGYTVLQNNA